MPMHGSGRGDTLKRCHIRHVRRPPSQRTSRSSRSLAAPHMCMYMSCAQGAGTSDMFHPEEGAARRAQGGTGAEDLLESCGAVERRVEFPPTTRVVSRTPAWFGWTARGVPAEGSPGHRFLSPSLE